MENQKIRMAKAVTILTFILVAFLAVKIMSDLKAYHYIGETNGPATIAVFGTGEVIVKPDIATFDFTVTSEAKSVADAQKSTTDKMNTIMAFLKQNGIDSKDIKTIDYSVFPRYDYAQVSPVSDLPPTPANGRILAGYDVSQSVEVKIRDLSFAGKVLSGVGQNGATNVSGLMFTEDNRNDLAKQAEAAAISDARTNAKALAKNLGVSIVRLVSYQSSGGAPAPMQYGIMSKSGSSVPEIPSGENKITSNVTLIYEVR